MLNSHTRRTHTHTPAHTHTQAERSKAVRRRRDAALGKLAPDNVVSGRLTDRRCSSARMDVVLSRALLLYTPPRQQRKSEPLLIATERTVAMTIQCDWRQRLRHHVRSIALARHKHNANLAVSHSLTHRLETQ